MADKTIPALTDATLPLTGSETIHIVQGGASREVSLSDVAAISTGAMLKATYDPNDDGIIAVAQGGSGAATAAGARTNYGLKSMAVQDASAVAITGGSITGITDLAVADGGTGGSTPAAARTSLELVYGVNVQAWSANLDGFAATTVANVQNRVNHTGTQLAATISDFSTAADLRIAAAIGSTVQAWSDNLDGWAALEPSAKQDESALLTSVSALSLTAGDLIYATSATTVARLPVGANGQVLALQDGVPQWDTELVVGGLLAANDLSDVDDAATALSNIGGQPVSANLTTLAGVVPGSKGLAILADTTSDAVHEELARDWSGATAGAPTLSVPNIMQRRYVDVGAYCSLTDTDSARVGIVAAMADAPGREIVFTNPTGGKRYYRVPDRAGGRIFLPTAETFRMICEPGAIIDFSDFGNGTGLTSSAYFYGTGTVGTEHVLTANAATDTNTVTVSTSDAANYAAGDDIFVRSDALFTTEESTLGTQGEWATVVSVNTGTGVLTLGAKLRASYNTADDAYITKVTPISCSVENLNIIGAGRFADNTSADRGLQIVNGKNIRVIGGDFKYCDFNQIAFVNVLNGLVDGTRILFDPKGSTTGLQYGVGFNNMCENTWGRNVDVNGGSEGLVLSSTGQPQGVCRDVGFDNCRVRGSTRSGACTHDNHENWMVTNCTFEDCEQGIDHRINGGVFTGNVMRRMGAYSGDLNCGIQIGSGAGKFIFRDNVIEDALRGVYRPSSIVDETATGAIGDISISHNVMRAIGGAGILYNVNTADDEFSRGALEIVGNDISGVTSGTAPIGIQVEGKWSNPVVARNILRGGNNGRSIWLYNASAGGSNGPINPTVVDNIYDNYTEPLIQHSTGRWNVYGNRQYTATALPSVASASAIALPTSGYVFNVTGTTTINTITGAARHVGQTIVLMFAASVTVTNNANAGAANDIQLSGAANFSATANDQLMLVSNGTLWREVSRTAI